MITAENSAEHNLSDEEYARILEILGREPNLVELGIFSAMWSEHCSYKSSRVHLKKFPTTGPRVHPGAGRERRSRRHRRRPRGRLQDGVAQPSLVHRALPGRGDGRRRHPARHLHDGRAADRVAELAALRRARRPAHEAPRRRRRARDRRLRQLHRHPDGRRRDDVPSRLQRQHPRQRHERRDRARRTGSSSAAPRASATRSSTSARRPGRDGIHGATMASEEFAADEAKQKRPTVQVGDPFTEKLLMEACLELFETDAVVGIQDMGAAGLTSSSFEMAGRAGSGVEIDLSKVPVRETGMTPYEIMLSESQERMLLVARRDRLDEGPRDLPQVGPRCRRDRPRHGLRPRRPLLRGPDRRGPAGRAARRPRARLRPAARGAAAPPPPRSGARSPSPPITATACGSCSRPQRRRRSPGSGRSTTTWSRPTPSSAPAATRRSSASRARTRASR